VALVTGGGRGIGRAICLALAEDGADIAVNYYRDAESAQETVTAIQALGAKARAFRAPLEDFEEDEAMVHAALAEFGHLDILVHNAARASLGHRVADTDPEELERVMRCNALAPHFLSKLVLPSMREQPRGDIVMISSVATQYDAAKGAPYSMSKAALESLAFTLAKEERRNGIHVNVVAPGLVDTEMGKRMMKANQGIENLRQLDPAMPYGHVCSPEEVADVVRFLVSDGGRYVNGQRIYVDGGGMV
jgi:NAD(P)-dependent dehydrogenase (short-subunit alcohol dehydrogenase family)